MLSVTVFLFAPMLNLYEFEHLQRSRQNGKQSQNMIIIGTELYRGHGGEDKAFSECPEALSGIRP